jgi:hypothetical protein
MARTSKMDPASTVSTEHRSFKVGLTSAAQCRLCHCMYMRQHASQDTKEKQSSCIGTTIEKSVSQQDMAFKPGPPLKACHTCIYTTLRFMYVYCMYVHYIKSSKAAATFCLNGPGMGYRSYGLLRWDWCFTD